MLVALSSQLLPHHASHHFLSSSPKECHRDDLEHTASHHRRLGLSHHDTLVGRQKVHQVYLHLRRLGQVHALCQVLELHEESLES